MYMKHTTSILNVLDAKPWKGYNRQVNRWLADCYRGISEQGLFGFFCIEVRRP